MISWTFQANTGYRKTVTWVSSGPSTRPPVAFLKKTKNLKIRKDNNAQELPGKGCSERLKRHLVNFTQVWSASIQNLEFFSYTWVIQLNHNKNEQKQKQRISLDVSPEQTHTWPISLGKTALIPGLKSKLKPQRDTKSHPLGWLKSSEKWQALVI